VADESQGNESRNSALAQKYACSGPRYTSYPTALQFNEDFSMEQFLERQSDTTLGSIEPLSLYVHIPFCRDICYYCACNKIVTRDAGVARRYLDALRNEIAMRSSLHGKQRPVRQMHWGGGTPTFLDSAEITELMHELASHFMLLDEGYREYSIEIDPRTVDNSKIALLKGLGFNRISLGIQDFDPLVQKSINRQQPYAAVRELVQEIRRHEFRSLSFDLIYGLPHQDVYTMDTTLDKVLELRPDRISIYNYAHLPDRFPSQRAIDRLTLPSVDQKLALQDMIAAKLSGNGYTHVGLDHYVLPEDDLAIAQREGRLQRNFQGYSVQMASDLVGLGVSSISQVQDCYLQNARQLEEYYALLEANRFPVTRGCQLTADDKLRRHIIMELICNLKLDISACNDRFGVEFASVFAPQMERLRDMQRDGLVTLDDNEICITETGRPFLRVVCMCFDAYLDNAGNTGQNLIHPQPESVQRPRFSATL
jgi:oxygen-independent coproporphyrinogen-3 oxidase